MSSYLFLRIDTHNTMTLKEKKQSYKRSEKDVYKLQFPYAMIVRESDGAILFINRDSAALHSSFVRVPEDVVTQIAALGDTDGPTPKGFKTYWFYNSKNAPYDFIDKPEYISYRHKMDKIGTLLKPYHFLCDMYFDNPTSIKNYTVLD